MNSDSGKPLVTCAIHDLCKLIETNTASRACFDKCIFWQRTQGELISRPFKKKTIKKHTNVLFNCCFIFDCALLNNKLSVTTKTCREINSTEKNISFKVPTAQ